ncbi:MAG: glycoside hydrolase family 127 protein [Lachnospiraceae bacterium]|nr:glycoside hydrolase family 127 protein [Lachnospiraceae bacterium]
MLIRNFALDTVELTDPVFEKAFQKEQEYLRSVDCDRLLAGFREAAGLAKIAERYPDGLEEEETSGLRLGHYMTALSQLFAATGAKDIEERMDYILRQLAECQTENGYLSAAPEEVFDRVERGEQASMPWYTMHRVLAGLLSMYQLGKRPHAMEIAVKLGTWVHNRTALWTDEMRGRVLLTEYGGMNDCLYELYKETGRKEFATAAAKFDDIELFYGITEGLDTLFDKRTDTAVPKILGALNRYFALGESESFYLKTAQSFFDIVTEHYSYVTGDGCKTPDTYNMLKLAEGLFFVTGEKRYMDFYERAFLSAVSASRSTDTGMENFTKLNSAVYHTGENRLYVNMYLASVLHDKKLNLNLTQKTDLNHIDSVTFSLSLKEEKAFTLALRIPEWTKQRFELKLNGEPADYAVREGYILLERLWEKEQQISLRMFPEITLQLLPEAPNVQDEPCKGTQKEKEPVTESVSDGVPGGEPERTPGRKRGKRREKKKCILIISGHMAGVLVLLVLLYLFAEPVGKAFMNAKYAVDAFLQKRMPGVAEVFGVKESENGDLPVSGDDETEEKKRYVAEPEAYAASCTLPQGYRAFVTTLDGKEYICVEGSGLRVYYLNEIPEDGEKYVYLETMTGKAVYFWDYSFDVPEALCFTRSVHNTSGVEQYVFFEEGTSDTPHLLDVKTLKEHEIASYAKELALLVDVAAYTEEGKTVLLDTVIGGVSYLFSVPKAGGAFEMSDYTPCADYGLAYTLEQDGIRFDSYVVSSDVYLGKVVGRLAFTGYGYELDSLQFYAYAEENYADVGGDSVIRGVSLAEAEKERIKITGDLGEKLLIPVREDVEKHNLSTEGFVKDENGEYRYVENGQTVTIKGVDVSKYQEDIDWERVAASGVEFAMIRLGFRGMGTKGTCELDPFFKQNIEQALAAGVKVGVYFFTQATTVEEAREEAAFVIENLKGYDITWPVVYDTEEITSYKAARANALSRETRTACAKAFLEEIRAAGYTPMLYANTRWSILKLDLAKLSAYDFWYAYYGDSIYYPYKFSMWQYTSSGEVDGITGKADMNISFVDYGAKE